MPFFWTMFWLLYYFIQGCRLFNYARLTSSRWCFAGKASKGQTQKVQQAVLQVIKLAYSERCFLRAFWRWSWCFYRDLLIPLACSNWDSILVFDLQKFRSGGYNTIVATSIAEEGLDIMEVDLVICFDANISPLRMIQRMGRTGRKRDGRVDILFSICCFE